MKLWPFILLIFVAFAGCRSSGGPPTSFQGRTLKAIQDRGYVICGVNAHLPGFGFLTPNGEYAGHDIDFCRALSAAIFRGDTTRVKYRSLSAKERFVALLSGEVDVLFRNTTWTLSRETDLACNFGPVTFHDGQGIMVPIGTGVNRIEELEGAAIGVTAGTTSELNLADQMASRGINYKPILFEATDDLFAAFESGRVDAVTGDKSSLYARRTKLSNPKHADILPETLSKEPFCPMVRHGDDKWYDLVRWVVHATVFAEENRLTSENIDNVQNTTQDPRIRQFLGLEGSMGRKLGLPSDWAYQVVKNVGNYREIYERNLGNRTAINLPRDKNELYGNGGLLYSPPFR